jgi:hypothetical protein
LVAVAENLSQSAGDNSLAGVRYPLLSLPQSHLIVLEELCCIRFRPVHRVELSSAYVQPSPHKMVRRPFPGPTRGAAATLEGFSPLSTHRGLGFSLLAAYICNTLCIYEIIDFRGITPLTW